MGKLLFIPLNTNHVAIFQGIIPFLRSDYEMLCHDRISDAEQYHTEAALREWGILYRHFERKIHRSTDDPLTVKISQVLQTRKLIKETLELVQPRVVVFAIDNDPIAQLFIAEAKRRGILSVLIQEALIRPDEYRERKNYASDYGHGMLRALGLPLSYIPYGMGDCDRILVSGKRARRILEQRGVPAHKLVMTGMPKYDSMVKNLKHNPPQINARQVYVFAASTNMVKDEQNVRFLRKLIGAAETLGIYLIIKLHPRSPETPSEIYKIVNTVDTASFEIIKEGDRIRKILETADGLVTVSSTVVLDALIMGKECVIVDYLAGEARLHYGDYDAVHTIRSEEAIPACLLSSMTNHKNWENKIHLLNDELYKLDGRSGNRAAFAIEEMLHISTQKGH